jgi:hypothetical protein
MAMHYDRRKGAVSVWRINARGIGRHDSMAGQRNQIGNPIRFDFGAR